MYYLAIQLLRQSIAFIDWTIGSFRHYSQEAVATHPLHQRRLPVSDYGLEANRILLCEHC